MIEGAFQTNKSVQIGDLVTARVWLMKRDEQLQDILGPSEYILFFFQHSTRFSLHTLAGVTEWINPIWRR